MLNLLSLCAYLSSNLNSTPPTAERWIYFQPDDEIDIDRFI